MTGQVKPGGERVTCGVYLHLRVCGGVIRPWGRKPSSTSAQDLKDNGLVIVPCPIILLLLFLLIIFITF